MIRCNCDEKEDKKMSQNNNYNNLGSNSYGQQPQYGQQPTYNQQQAYNQQMTYNQQPQYGQQPPYRPQQPVRPAQPSGGNNYKMPLIIGGIVAGVIIVCLVVVLILEHNKNNSSTTASAEPSTKTATEAKTEARKEVTTEEFTWEDTEAATEAPTEAKTEAATEAVTEATTVAVTEAATEAPTEATTEATDASVTPAPSSTSTVAGLSDDIYSEQIAINGTVYHLPFDYSNISNDYTFDMADYGHDDNYTLNPQDKVTSTIDLKNPNMDKDVDFYVGFMNTSNEPKKIKETSIWAVDFDITWADSTDYPEVVLPKGITWGSTLAEVKAAYGEPTDDPYYAESLGYWEYTYEDDDYDYSLSLIIYEDKGVTEISVKSYKAD